MANCPWSPNALCDTELFSDLNSAFIIGSNSPERREYIDLIKEVLEEFNLEPSFALDLDQFNGKISFCTHICGQIRKSRIIVTDLSGSTDVVCFDCDDAQVIFSANVFWEYGYAAALEKDPIIICDEKQKPPFDVGDKNAEFYNKSSLKELLRPIIKQRLNAPIPITSQSSNMIPIIDSKDTHINMLRTLLKKYLIKYYYEVKNPPKNPETDNKVNILIEKLQDLGDSQAIYFRDHNGSVKHKRIISAYFGNTKAFGESIRTSEMGYDDIEKRELIILAGDLALVFYDHYEDSLNTEKNYLKFIRQDFESEIKKYEFLEENYDERRFLHSLDILEKTFRLVSQFGPKWKDSESLTEWKIINPQKLEDFVQKKSINIILRKIYKPKP